MLRFVEAEAAVVADLSRSKHGRGAYVHISSDCLLAGDVEQKLLRSLKRLSAREGKRSAGPNKFGAFIARIETEVRQSHKDEELLNNVLKQYRSQQSDAGSNRSTPKLRL